MHVPANELMLVNDYPPVAIGEDDVEERVEQIVDQRAVDARDNFSIALPPIWSEKRHGRRLAVVAIVHDRVIEDDWLAEVEVDGIDEEEVSFELLVDRSRRCRRWSGWPCGSAQLPARTEHCP